MGDNEAKISFGDPFANNVFNNNNRNQRQSLFEDIGQQPQYDQFQSPPMQQQGGMMGGMQSGGDQNTNVFMGNFGNFSFENNVFAKAGLNYVMNSGKHFMQDNVGKYSSTISGLKYYFNVSNSYVLNKLKLLLFPIAHKSWQRRQNGQDFCPPHDDINAPDLYIPTMAFVTYVLLVGFILGTQLRFTPELLGATASKGLVALFLEIVAIKLAFYLLSVPNNVPILDISAYSGYKYVSIVLSAIAYQLGSYAYWPVLLATGLAMSWFMIRTLRRAVVDTSDGRLRIDEHTPKRNYFLFIIAVLQIPQIWWMSRI